MTPPTRLSISREECVGSRIASMSARPTFRIPEVAGASAGGLVSQRSAEAGSAAEVKTALTRNRLWLAHNSIEVTHQIYGHLVPSSLDRARTALDYAYQKSQKQRRPALSHPAARQPSRQVKMAVPVPVLSDGQECLRR